MQDLKDVTHATHYQNFRKQKLNMMFGLKVGLKYSYLNSIYNEKESLIEEDIPGNEEDQSLDSLGFEWEKMFGKLSNERLEQLQRYSRDQRFRKLPSLSSSNDLDSFDSGRTSHSNEKRVCNKSIDFI